jgi:hypothetical protein
MGGREKGFERGIRKRNQFESLRGGPFLDDGVEGEEEFW